jgi:hypothetical protein
VLGPLRTALEACKLRGPFASVSWGPPAPDDGRWLGLDGFATDAGAEPALRRFAPHDDAGKLYGLWALQNIANAAPLVAGYLYATQQRVPVLQANAMLDESSRWLNHLRLLEPRFWALPCDPLAGAARITLVPDHQQLTTRLFTEVERTYGPIIHSFRARRLVSIPNAWASVVDGLHRGFILAGQTQIGLDAAWQLWQATTSTWNVATHRWPRRLRYTQDGLPDEMVVRAACCVVYTVPNRVGLPRPYCANCPLDIGDEGRVQRRVAWLKQKEAEQQAAAEGTR